MARIFLCHASEDKPQVRDVYQRLKALGFEPWLDEVDILPGQDWDYEIETALEQSDFVIVFLSTRSVAKMGYVQREFRRAMYHSEEMPEGYIHTIPVKLDDCVVPRRFSRHQWANLSEEGAFDRIVRALHYGLEQRGEPVPEPTVAVSSQPPSAPPASARPHQVNVAPPQGAVVAGILEAMGHGSGRTPSPHSESNAVDVIRLHGTDFVHHALGLLQLAAQGQKIIVSRWREINYL